jgi:hypothetical protein
MAYMEHNHHYWTINIHDRFHVHVFGSLIHGLPDMIIGFQAIATILQTPHIY